MRKNLLITFGCSWTFGVGAGYESGMTNNEYSFVAWDPEVCGKNSYRGLLSEALMCDNVNFAHGASSNQAQFYYAKKYFSSTEFLQAKQNYANIIVVHAITSTARNMLFDIKNNRWHHVKYDSQDHFSEFMVKHSYDHNNEVRQLALEMEFWNIFYRNWEIQNIWIDTFNHHDYGRAIDNMIDWLPQRDLLSQLCIRHGWSGSDQGYHNSSWTQDTVRIEWAAAHGLVNPISYHPTFQSHREIADMLMPFIQQKSTNGEIHYV